MATKNMIDDLFTNEKWECTNYDTQYKKIQFLLIKHEVLEHLMAYRSLGIGKDENDKDGITSEQYQERT